MSFNNKISELKPLPSPPTSFYFVIFILSLKFSRHSVIAIEDGCPSFLATPITNFEKLLGQWYIHSWIENRTDFSSISCIDLNRNSKNSTDEPWELEVHLTSNTTATEKHTAYVPNNLAPGRWSVNKRGIDYNITILYTNYDYSMWAQCSVSNGTRFLQIFFASRDKDEIFPTILKQQLTQILSGNYGINVTIIYDVPKGSHVCTEKAKKQKTMTMPGSTTKKGSGKGKLILIIVILCVLVLVFIGSRFLVKHSTYS